MEVHRETYLSVFGVYESSTLFNYSHMFSFTFGYVEQCAVGRREKNVGSKFDCYLHQRKNDGNYFRVNKEFTRLAKGTRIQYDVINTKKFYTLCTPFLLDKAQRPLENSTTRVIPQYSNSSFFFQD